MEELLFKSVDVRWFDDQHDWYWFILEKIDGDMIKFKGISSPEGFTHDGSSFWVNRSEIKSISEI